MNYKQANGIYFVTHNGKQLKLIEKISDYKNYVAECELDEEQAGTFKEFIQDEIKVTQNWYGIIKLEKGKCKILKEREGTTLKNPEFIKLLKEYQF